MKTFIAVLVAVVLGFCVGQVHKNAFLAKHTANIETSVQNKGKEVKNAVGNTVKKAGEKMLEN